MIITESYLKKYDGLNISQVLWYLSEYECDIDLNESSFPARISNMALVDGRNCDALLVENRLYRFSKMNEEDKSIIRDYISKGSFATALTKLNSCSNIIGYGLSNNLTESEAINFIKISTSLLGKNSADVNIQGKPIDVLGEKLKIYESNNGYILKAGNKALLENFIPNVSNGEYKVLGYSRDGSVFNIKSISQSGDLIESFVTNVDEDILKSGINLDYAFENANVIKTYKVDHINLKEYVEPFRVEDSALRDYKFNDSGVVLTLFDKYHHSADLPVQIKIPVDDFKKKYANSMDKIKNEKSFSKAISKTNELLKSISGDVSNYAKIRSKKVVNDYDENFEDYQGISNVVSGCTPLDVDFKYTDKRGKHVNPDYFIVMVRDNKTGKFYNVPYKRVDDNENIEDVVIGLIDVLESLNVEVEGFEFFKEAELYGKPLHKYALGNSTAGRRKSKDVNECVQSADIAPKVDQNVATIDVTGTNKKKKVNESNTISKMYILTEAEELEIPKDRINQVVDTSKVVGNITSAKLVKDNDDPSNPWSVYINVNGKEEPYEQGKGLSDEDAKNLTTVEPEEPTETKSTEDDYEKPSIDLLNDLPDGDIPADELGSETCKLIEETFEDFGIKVQVVEVNPGPTVTEYALKPGPGVRVNTILNLDKEIAMALGAKNVQIEDTSEKGTVSVYLVNSQLRTVPIKEVLETIPEADGKSINFALGDTTNGTPEYADISKLKHLLVAGATGSGKSVMINSLVSSIVMRENPNNVKLLLIDPKKVELSKFNGIPHLLTPVITNPSQASSALKSMVKEMDKRYDAFRNAGVKDIDAYNKRAEQKMPYIVIVIDELADLMMTAPEDVENSIKRITQLARAAGMHLVVATQRPTTDIITGTIKANIPSRIAFATASNTDSRVILDAGGAEKLNGKGDMLFSEEGATKPVRLQGAFISDDEINKIVKHATGQKLKVDSGDYMESAKILSTDLLVESLSKRDIRLGKLGFIRNSNGYYYLNECVAAIKDNKIIPIHKSRINNPPEGVTIIGGKDNGKD